MPSATMYRPRSGRAQNASSFEARRRPGCVAAAQRTRMLAQALERADTSDGRTSVVIWPRARDATCSRRMALSSGVAGALVVEVLGLAPEPGLGTLACFFGAADVDVLGEFGNLREHGHGVGQHLGQAGGDREHVALLADPVGEPTDGERREQRRVPRQHAEVALGAWQLDLVGLDAHEFAFGRDDAERELAGHAIRCLPLTSSGRRPSRAPPRWCRPCRTPAPGRRRACRRRSRGSRRSCRQWSRTCP